MEVKEIIKEELFKAVVESLIIEDILRTGTLNESVDFNAVLQRVKDYAQKGALTGTILAGLMSSPAFSQQQKQVLASIGNNGKNYIETPSKPENNPPLNYKLTSDPNVVIGKHGAIITRQEYLASLKVPDNTLKFNTFEDYANWVGGWARGKNNNIETNPPSPANIPNKDMSDKARGYSNTYYAPNPKTPDIPAAHTNGYFRTN